jgi:Tol biopolymer transport system component
MSRAAISLWPVVLVLASGSSAGQGTTRVSLTSAGGQADGSCQVGSISADGRYVAFLSPATNLVPGDTNGFMDVFVRDRYTGTTERVSVDSSGTQANNFSSFCEISADGRFVCFASPASNLVAGDTNSAWDIFVHDRLSGTTERVSVGSGGTQAGTHCFSLSISGDGRFVAFHTWSSNLVAGDTNGAMDVFVRDRQAGTTERVSVDSSGAQANSHCVDPAISADGRFVAFSGEASNLVAHDVNGYYDMFVRDRQTGTTEIVSVDSEGVQADGDTTFPASFSRDGRFLVYSSNASNLVAGDTNGSVDVFLRDRLLKLTELVGVDSSGAQFGPGSTMGRLSADGRFVGFSSGSCSSGPCQVDALLRDRAAGRTEVLSVDLTGVTGVGTSNLTAISADGRFAIFQSDAPNLVAGDTNGVLDIFLRDRGTPGPGASLCQPGSAGVIACPCANPSGLAPRGCDNSESTGGAQLASSGSASLSADSVLFFTSGETLAATSIVLQGDAVVTNGAVFGQGVRCAGGSLLRLYAKTASAGSITAPLGGDPSVSASSAALGGPIGAGTRRWYAVYYRDVIVLGGCPAASTFNSTQTQLVDWGP